MINILEVLQSLAEKRPIFHSEADFQHALAWEIHSRYPKSKIRLEFKPPNIRSRIYTDIWVAYQGKVFAIELKYKTKKINCKYNNESFSLLNQSAYPGGRYDFLRDIQRLEHIISKNNKTIGYAIFLTNDRNYWNESKRKYTVDSNFKIHDGKKIEGKLQWKGKLAKWMQSRKNFKIKSTYKLKWNAYSRVLNSEFKHLLVKIDLKFARIL